MRFNTFGGTGASLRPSITGANVAGSKDPREYIVLTLVNDALVQRFPYFGY